MSGIIYDFLLYGGEDTFRQHTFSDTEELLGHGGKVVIALCISIKEKPCSFVYFDNFFSSLELLIFLREKYGILSLETVRSNRLRGCPLTSDKDMKRGGRGSFDIRVCNRNKICVVKWLDNKPVCLASTFCEAEPVTQVKRIEPKAKSNKSKDQPSNNVPRHPRSKVDVTCPDIVKKYNAFMGGVDLADMLIALYRTGLRTHKWYLSIFSQILDMCVSNAWLVYRRDCARANIKNADIKALKEFRWSIANNLLAKGRRLSVDPKTPKVVAGTKRPSSQIDQELRYDRLDHFPTTTNKGRCRFCQKGQTRIKCMKCDHRLCLTQDKNCFYQFHFKA